jgi:glutamate synthase (NADPH/NADH) small chain
MGHKVTIFESLHEPGGVLMYGIPEFRLPKEVVQREINCLKYMDVQIVPNIVVGKSVTVDELLTSGYQAVFIGSGAGLPHFLGIPGEQLNGVFSANEFLTRCNLMRAREFPAYDTPIGIGERVAVIGAGNVAMDSARTALRLGAEKVFIIYRRSKEEMPARDEEIEHALAEGVEFHLQTAPVKIVAMKRAGLWG